MWPWGHLAFAYVLYSVLAKAWPGTRVRDSAALVLGFGALLPDLVDKPLAWTFAVFPSGYAVAHSVFVAVPVGLAVAAVAARRGRAPVGVAFLVGYWSHLVGDIAFAVALSEPYTISRVLWPLVVLRGGTASIGTLDRIGHYLVEYVALLVRTGDSLALLAYAGMFVAAFVLWVADGAPVLRAVVRWTVGTARPGAGGPR